MDGWWRNVSTEIAPGVAGTETIQMGTVTACGIEKNQVSGAQSLPTALLPLLGPVFYISISDSLFVTSNPGTLL